MVSVLVIDDEPQVRALVRTTLESSGYQVCEASNGVEGIKAFGSQPFDLVICDIFMPEKDGYETIQELHAQSKVKIIGVTGNLMGLEWPVNLMMAKRFGASSVMLKPFQPSELLEQVQSVLAER